MAKRELPDPELLRKLLQYEAETGKLFWRMRPLAMFPNDQAGNTWNSKHAGTEALITPDSKGYMTGKIFDRRYKAHRVIWAIMHGRWPANQIDHVNGKKTDNRITNLRDVFPQENSKNCKRPKSNRTGVVGVYKKSNAWTASIRAEGKTLHLGTFRTKEDAAQARAAADIKYGYHPNHGRAA